MIEIYFDGGCKPNPGEREIGVVIPSIELMHHDRFGHGTNNEAEWIAAITALELALRRGFLEVHLKGDSTLVVNQAKGVWKCKKPELQVFLDEFKRMRPQFRRLVLEYVPREKNLAGHYIELVNS